MRPRSKGSDRGRIFRTAEARMTRYIANRLLLTIPTLIGVAILVFFLLRVIPGDVVEVKLRADGGSVSQETIEMERKRLGLDKPLPAQFKDWMVGLATFDLGRSMWTERPVAEEIRVRLELSLELAIMATIFAVLIAIPLGMIAALMRDTWVDYVVRIVTIAGLATPSFWLGMLIMLGLLYTLNWLPPITFTPIYVDPLANVTQLVWPAMAVGYRYSAVVARMIRSSLLEVLSEDYIRTARAKGVYERLVLWRHALPNALLPAITVIGLEFAFLIGGLVVTEQVFNLNGIGQLFVQSVARSDFTLIQGRVMMIAVFYIVVNLAVDLLYAAFDPRIRYR
jgi:peptide/nickel transport system permease protein